MNCQLKGRGTNRHPTLNCAGCWWINTATWHWGSEKKSVLGWKVEWSSMHKWSKNYNSNVFSLSASHADPNNDTTLPGASPSYIHTAGECPLFDHFTNTTITPGERPIDTWRLNPWNNQKTERNLFTAWIHLQYVSWGCANSSPVLQQWLSEQVCLHLIKLRCNVLTSPVCIIHHVRYLSDILIQRRWARMSKYKGGSASCSETLWHGYCWTELDFSGFSAMLWITKDCLLRKSCAFCSKSLFKVFSLGQCPI